MCLNLRPSFKRLTLVSYAALFATSAHAVDFTNTTTGAIGGPTPCGTTDLVRTFTVTDDFTISDVDLSLQINHTWRGDIDIRLISPANTTAQLTIADTSLTGNIDNYNIILDDDGVDLINTGSHTTADGTVAPPFENRVRPENPLSIFNSEMSAGTWTLRICDALSGFDDGTFNIGVLSLTPLPMADISAVKSVEVIDPSGSGSTDVYMIPGNEVLYKITVTNSATSTAMAENIDITDTLPETLRFLSATSTGFVSGTFATPALPATNTDCAGGACVISFDDGVLAANSTGEIAVTALIK